MRCRVPPSLSLAVSLCNHRLYSTGCTFQTTVAATQWWSGVVFGALRISKSDLVAATSEVHMKRGGFAANQAELSREFKVAS